MRVLWGHSAEVQVWVGWRIPYVRMRMERDADAMAEPFGNAQAAGVIDSEGRLVAGVVYHNYNPDCPSFELSFAADSRKWLTRAIICELLRYPFTDLQCRRVTSVTPQKTATSARKFLDQFGFKREGCVRFGFGKEHAIISGLLRSEWEQSRFNRRREPSAAAVQSPVR